jgi:hypothetical protein
MMQAYLVRVIDTHEIVGIFVCRKSDMLHVIDECCDPCICEYTKLDDGGIFFPHRSDVKVPVEYDEETDECKNDIRWEELTVSEGWRYSLYGHSNNRWHPIVRDRDDFLQRMREYTGKPNLDMKGIYILDSLAVSS